MTNLSELAWPEVRDRVRRGEGVVIPVGTIEQHGPHLPISTDVLIAEALARQAADGLPLMIAPTITYGYRSRPRSGGGDGFVGTVPLSGVTFMSVVREIVETFIDDGFRFIALVNWHFENQNFLYEAVHEAMRGRAAPRVALFESAPAHSLTDATVADLFDGDFPGWDREHAAVAETSLMMHLAPHLVRADLIVDDSAKEHVWYDVFPTPPAHVAESGVLARARNSTAAKGERFWLEMVAELRTALLTEHERS